MTETALIELDSNDIAWIVRRLPTEVRDLLVAQRGRVFVAGGFLRSCIANEPVADVDLFVDSPASAEQHIRTLLAGLSDAAWTVRTANAITLKWQPRVQIIHRWTFATPEECIRSFDFTIARAAVWYGEGWRGVCDPRFYCDLAAKRLIYCAPEREEEAGGSLLRLLKFYQRGYRVPLYSLGALLARVCNGVDLTSIHTESDRATAFMNVLQEVDPAFDPEHLAHLPNPDDIHLHAVVAPILEEEEVEF